MYVQHRRDVIHASPSQREDRHAAVPVPVGVRVTDVPRRWEAFGSGNEWHRDAMYGGRQEGRRRSEGTQYAPESVGTVLRIIGACHTESGVWTVKPLAKGWRGNVRGGSMPIQGVEKDGFEMGS
jgi:hypothetical protein